MNDETATQNSVSVYKSRSWLKKRLYGSLLAQYKRFKLKRVDLSPENSLSTIRHLLEKVQFLFVITQSLDPVQHGEDREYKNDSLLNAQNSSQGCSARYVQPIVEWQDELFTIWVGTLASSRKIAEIRHNPNVTLALGNDSAVANLIIHGKATLHTDIQKKLQVWKPEWKLFFPDGPKDDDYIVIRIEPERLELMDIKRGITPEPFGLKPLHLVLREGSWQAAVN